MNNRVFSLFALFVGLVLAQSLLFDRLLVAQQYVPYVSLLFIVLYPTDLRQTMFLVVAFLYGLSIDLLSVSGGIHAGACLSAAFLRPVVLRSVFGISSDYSTVKFSKIPFVQWFVYCLLIVLIHHLVLFGLSDFSINRWLWILKQTVFNGLLTTAVVSVFMFLFVSKK
jgi:hypothetical protein